jgi:5-methylcytosine-specific restriction endonuclease McrA
MKWLTPRPKVRRSNGVSKIIRDNYGATKLDWWDKVKEINERDTYLGVLICTYCGKPIEKGEKREVHHYQKLTSGGVTRNNNLGTVHSSCHDKIHPHLKGRR